MPSNISTITTNPPSTTPSTSRSTIETTKPPSTTPSTATTKPPSTTALSTPQTTTNHPTTHTSSLSKAQADMLATSNDITKTIFNKFNIVFLIWFLAIYLIIYFILGIFYNSDSGTSKKLVASRIFDFLVLLFFLIVIVVNFLLLNDSDKEKVIKNNASNIMQYVNTLSTLLYISIFFILFYAIIYLTGIPMTYIDKPITITMIEGFAWILFALCLIANFCKYVLGVSIVNLFNEWINKEWNSLNDLSGVDLSGVVLSVVDLSKNEVFHISNNLYTYDDAQAVCKVYGSRLATYDDIEQSYNDGGEWCGYGWSENQMIFYPTQKKTWDTLQKNPKTKNNCGRPGINGGYIENPYVRFGVNCYGVKPEATSDDLNAIKQSKITPKTPQDLLLEKKIKFFRDNSANIMNVNAFNNNKWSEYYGVGSEVESM